MKRFRYIFLFIMISLISLDTAALILDFGTEHSEMFLLEFEKESKEHNEKEESKDQSKKEFEELYWENLESSFAISKLRNSSFTSNRLQMQHEQSIPDPPPDCA